MRIREGSSFVPKQLIFEQRIRQGTAVQGNEWTVCSAAEYSGSLAQTVLLPVPVSPMSKTAASLFLSVMSSSTIRKKHGASPTSFARAKVSSR